MFNSIFFLQSNTFKVIGKNQKGKDIHLNHLAVYNKMALQKFALFTNAFIKKNPIK